MSYNTENGAVSVMDIIASPITTARLTSVLPGRTYTVNVSAVSNGQIGEPATATQTTGLYLSSDFISVLYLQRYPFNNSFCLS